MIAAWDFGNGFANYYMEIALHPVIVIARI